MGSKLLGGGSFPDLYASSTQLEVLLPRRSKDDLATIACVRSEHLVRTVESCRIAEHLIQEHGLDSALEQATDGTTAAQIDGDNYQLSVWREVKA